MYFPRIPRVRLLMSLETILGLLGKSMCILLFYVHVRILWAIHTSLTADFERIQYDKPFQPHTISSKNIEASSSMQGSRTIFQAAQIWSINHASPLTIKYQKLRFQVALKKYRWYGGSDIFGWGQSSYSLYYWQWLASEQGMLYHLHTVTSNTTIVMVSLWVSLKFQEISTC